MSKLLEQYGCGPIQFAGNENALYERHLLFDRVIDPGAATPRDAFEAVARAVRDVLAQRWVHTESTYDQRNVKRLYYLSMEFLIGRSLANNIMNLRRNEPGVFGPIRELLLDRGDHYLHLADLSSYLEADGRMTALYADADGWARKSILNVAGSGKFSSDRTIGEYAKDIRGLERCPIP